MKKTISILFVLFSMFGYLIAQAPNSFKYQAVARTSSGDILANQPVDFTITILQGSIDGVSVYSETHSVTTNKFGLVTFNIGEGTAPSSEFSEIDWSTGAFFVEINLNGNLMGTSQLLSVPFAKYADTAGDSFTGDYNDLTNKPENFNDLDADPTNEIQDLSNVLSQGNNSEQKSILNLGRLSFDNESVHPDAAIDMSKSNKSFILSQLTIGQRNELEKVKGMMIYNIDDNKFQGVTSSFDTILDVNQVVGVGTGWFIDEDSMGYGMYRQSNLAQVFQPIKTGYMPRLSINMSGTHGILPHDILITIKTGDDPNSGTVLTSQIISITSSIYEWYDITLDDKVYLEAENSYILIAAFAECGQATPFRRVDWQRKSGSFSVPVYTGDNFGDMCPLNITDYNDNYGYSWLFKVYIIEQTLQWIDLH